MLDMVIDSTEKYVIDYRLTEITRGNQLLIKPGQPVIGFDDLGTYMVDQKYNPQVGTDKPGHEQVIQYNIHRAKRCHRYNEPENEMQEQNKLIDTC